MTQAPRIPDLSGDELAFAVFCVENLAARLNRSPGAMYRRLTAGSDVLHNYIIPCYEPLHTQDMDYILDDIQEALGREGGGA